MTSMGRSPSASSAVNYDTCGDGGELGGGLRGGQDVKTMIFSLFHSLETDEQKEVIEELIKRVRPADMAGI